MNMDPIEKMVDFLIEDLKETGEHLRETDRKVSFLIQLYSGSFVVLTTITSILVEKKIIDLNDGFTGVYNAVVLIVLLLFTMWLYYYTLRGKETKQIYIHRMNFLRREIHYALKNKNKDILGFWTEIKNPPKDGMSVTQVGHQEKRTKIALDDLYPIALRFVLIIVAIPLSITIGNTLNYFLELNPYSTGINVTLIITFLMIIGSAYQFPKHLKKKSDAKIENEESKYQVSSESREQKNTHSLI